MNLIKINTTDTHEIYIGSFEGQQVRFFKDLITGDVRINAEDMARTLGYESAHDMLGRDESLDALNAAYKETGVWPLTEI
jgi:prophage antirepressor-like protein